MVWCTMLMRARQKQACSVFSKQYQCILKTMPWIFKLDRSATLSMSDWEEPEQVFAWDLVSHLAKMDSEDNMILSWSKLPVNNIQVVLMIVDIMEPEPKKPLWPEKTSRMRNYLPRLFYGY